MRVPGPLASPRAASVAVAVALVALSALAACRGERTTARPDTAECALLTSADVSEITGTSVRAAPADSGVGADGDCATYVTPDGTVYVSISRLASMAEFTRAIGLSPARYPVRESLTGIGDEAMLFSNDDSGGRRLVARRGDRGAVVVTFDESVTDDQLVQLAARAVERL